MKDENELPPASTPPPRANEVEKGPPTAQVILMPTSHAEDQRVLDQLYGGGKRIQPAIDYLKERNLPPRVWQRCGIEVYTESATVRAAAVSCRYAEDSKAAKSEWLVVIQGSNRTTDGEGMAVFLHTFPFMPGKIFKVKGTLRPTDADGREMNRQGCIFAPPPTGFQSWDEIPDGSYVFVMESGVKAVNISLYANQWAIGLGGINSYSGGEGSGGPMIPVFSDPMWLKKRLKPVVLFDSPSTTSLSSRTNLEWAINVLAGRLVADQKVEGMVYHVPLPPPPPEMRSQFKNESWGVDDFIRHHGAQKFAELIRSDMREMTKTMPEEMVVDVVNARYERDLSEGNTLDTHTGVYLADPKLKGNLANFNVLVPEGFGPKAKMVDKNAYDLWMKSERRNQVDGARFAPGQKLYFTEPGPTGVPLRLRNTYNGLSVKPWDTEQDRAEGIARAERIWARRILDLYTHKGNDQWARRLMQMFASMVLHPDQRLDQFIFIKGPQNSGKGATVKAIELLVGRHATTGAPRQLIGQFLSHLIKKTLLVMHEASGQGRDGEFTLSRSDSGLLTDTIKNLVDSQRGAQQVEKKQEEMREVTMYLSLVMLSNFDPAFDHRAQGINRRFFYLETNDSFTRLTEDERVEFWEYVNSEVGLRDILTYLEQVPLEGLNTHRGVFTPWLRGLNGRTVGRSVKIFIETLAAGPDDLFGALGVPREIADRLTHLNASAVGSLYRLVDTREGGSRPPSDKSIGQTMAAYFTKPDKEGGEVPAKDALNFADPKTGKQNKWDGYRIRGEESRDKNDTVAAFRELEQWLLDVEKG